MTYFDATLETGPIEEQQSTPVLPEERFVFELIGFERSQPDQWRSEGGIKWTFLVFQEDGRTPFVFNDEQYQFFRTTGLTRDGRPNFNVGTYANDWASALLGRPLGVDANFSVSELRGKRMSAMVTWEKQRSDPKKKTIKLASLRHVPVGSAPATGAPSRAQTEASMVAAQAEDDLEREVVVAELTHAVKTAKKFGVPSYQTFKDALDGAASASLNDLKMILNNVNIENQKALDE